MTALRDTARAKLNLTLEVLGRRPDGLHELSSLVAFAELRRQLSSSCPDAELSSSISRAPLRPCLPLK